MPIAPPGSENPDGGDAAPAPEPEPEPIQTPEPAPEPTPATPNAPADGGGSGLLDGIIPEGFPSGWDLFVSFLEGVVDAIVAALVGVIDQFNINFMTLPVSGSWSNPAAIGVPTDPFWIGIYLVYGLLAVPSLMVAWGVGVFGIAVPRNLTRQERTIRLAKALVLIIAGFQLLQLWNLSWNTIALAFAPSGTEFMADPGNAAKLGIGVAAGLFVIAVKGVVLLVGIAIHVTFMFLTYLTVALWPLTIMLYFSEFFVTESAGIATMATTLLLTPIQAGKAIILRVLFELPLLIDNPATLLSFGFIFAGVFLAFVYLPWKALRKLVPHTIISAGGRYGRESASAASKAASNVPGGQELRERVARVAPAAGSTSLRQRARDTSLRSRDRDGRYSDPLSPFGTPDARTTQTGDYRTRTRAAAARADGGSRKPGITYRREPDFKAD